MAKNKVKASGLAEEIVTSKGTTTKSGVGSAINEAYGIANRVKAKARKNNSVGASATGTLGSLAQGDSFLPETVVPTAVYPTVTPRANYSDMYSAYEQAMNARANAYNAMSNADAADIARQLQIVGNQGKSALYGAQGVRGQDVSETSLLQNEMSTGNTQGSVRSAYDSAMREVGMAKDQNLADTDRLLGNQQASYENQLQDLANQHLRDVDSFNNSVAHNKRLAEIDNETTLKQIQKEMFINDTSEMKTIKAYNRAIKQLKKDGDVTNDWKINYLREKRDALQVEVDKQKLAAQKNAYSKTLSKYKSTDQIDKAIAAILSDGDTTNDWKLSYLNKYRTILNRKEVAARKAAKAAKKKSKSKSKSGGGDDGGGTSGANAIENAAIDFVNNNKGVTVNSATVDYYLATTDYNQAQKEAFKAYMQKHGAGYTRRR